MKLENENLALFLGSLCHELGNEEKASNVRSMAGIRLKNTLVVRDERQRTVLAARWLALADQTRHQIKSLALNILSSPNKDARSTACLVVAAIGGIEIPAGKWPDLIDALTFNIISNPALHVKEASLQTLGYICEQIPENLDKKSGQILNAISVGLSAEQKSVEIRQVATQALVDALGFAKSNMAQEKERNLIMTMLFTSATSDSEAIRASAYEGLVEVASAYYEYLNPYMTTIFQLTANAIQKDVDIVARQAVEFWSMIADVELEMLEDESEEAECMKLTQKALPNLLPLILVAMTKQVEDEDDDESWNLSKAADSFLVLAAQVTGDVIVQPVLNWVKANISSANWREREAAILAFGSILEGPDEAKLTPIATTALPIILNYFKDPHAMVKDTTAWTVGQICNVLPQVVTDAVLPNLMTTLVTALAEDARIATHTCWAIQSLAKAVEPDENGTSPLSRYFEGLLGGLFKVSERSDAADGNLLSASYDAITDLIRSSAPDVYPVVKKAFPALLQRLYNTFMNPGISLQERQKVCEAQGLLCGAVQAVVQKLPVEMWKDETDKIMTLLYKILETKGATAYEESWIAIGAVANQIEADFVKYIQPANMRMIETLQRTDEIKVLNVALGALGDIARAIKSRIAPFADTYMQLILSNLVKPTVDRTLRPSMVVCISDIAMAVSGFYDRYLNAVMSVILPMSIQAVENPTQSDQEYLNTLREAIAELLTATIHALNESDKAPNMLSYMDQIVKFVEIVNKDQERYDSVTKAVAGLIGDLVNCLDNKVGPQLSRNLSCSALVQSAVESEDDSIQEVGNWAKQALERFT